MAGPGPSAAPTRALARLAERGPDDAKTARELLAQGADPTAQPDGRTPPLFLAVGFDRQAIVTAMLDAGAPIDATFNWQAHPPSPQAILRLRPWSPRTWAIAFVIWRMNRRHPQSEDAPTSYTETVETECASPEMARLLMRYGAHPLAFDAEYRPAATGAERIAAQEITPEDFAETRNPRAGTANPEPCLPAFWSEQIRTGRSGHAGTRAIPGAAATAVAGEPVWSFDRFGQSASRLPDGRLVLIAGEHEDHYDPDFHIYNDVTVLDGNGGVDHYLYPREIFPPTDFHSATLLDDHILLIGNLGDQENRREGETQVLRLDLGDFSVSAVETFGDKPGWIHRHQARLGGNRIVVTGGKQEPDYRDRSETHVLDLATLRWSRRD